MALPGGYAAFVTQVGNGGPGPDGELLSLSDVTVRLDDRLAKGSLAPEALRASFPFTSQAHVGEDQEAWNDLQDRGNMSIGVSRWGFAYCLVLTGPERGRVWAMDDDQVAREADFLDWIEAWLAAAPEE